MFTSARLKLTAWYLLIIMLISIAFSIAIYLVLTNELDRVSRIQRLRQERGLTYELKERVSRIGIAPEVIEETKDRIIFILLGINVVILLTSSGAGFFLAGRTLKPIQQMINEQNRFITDSSHELRTPLTSLKSEIEVNLRDKKMSVEQARKILQSNLEEVNNLQYLSDNLIKLTQFQQPEKAVEENIDLSEVSKEAERKVSNLAKQKDITIKNQISNQVIRGNKQSLIELFVVFLDNAIKYSPKSKTVTLTSKETDNMVEIFIKDQGIGIDQKDIPHLFDRFYRACKSRTKNETGGYGLGLSIAKQIIEKHKGTIKVESKLNKGTTFTIQLPVR